MDEINQTPRAGTALRDHNIEIRGRQGVAYNSWIGVWIICPSTVSSIFSLEGDSDIISLNMDERWWKLQRPGPNSQGFGSCLEEFGGRAQCCRMWVWRIRWKLTHQIPPAKMLWFLCISLVKMIRIWCLHLGFLKSQLFCRWDALCWRWRRWPAELSNSDSSSSIVADRTRCSQGQPDWGRPHLLDGSADEDVSHRFTTSIYFHIFNSDNGNGHLHRHLLRRRGKPKLP